MKKRILSIVLCLCMALGLLPATALAADAPPTVTLCGTTLVSGKSYKISNLESLVETTDTTGDYFEYTATAADATLTVHGAPAVYLEETSTTTGLTVSGGTLTVNTGATTDEGLNLDSSTGDALSVTNGAVILTGSGYLSLISSNSNTVELSNASLTSAEGFSGLTEITNSYSSGLAIAATGESSAVSLVTEGKLCIKAGSAAPAVASAADVTLEGSYIELKNSGAGALVDANGSISITSTGAAPLELSGSNSTHLFNVGGEKALTLSSAAALTLKNAGSGNVLGGNLTVASATDVTVTGGTGSTSSLLGSDVSITATGAVSITGSVNAPLIEGDASIRADGDVSVCNTIAGTVDSGVAVNGAADITSKNGSIRITGNTGTPVIGGASASALTARKDITVINAHTTAQAFQTLSNLTATEGIILIGGSDAKTYTAAYANAYAYGGDVSAAQLNLYDAPKVKTGYLAGGGWALWTPTLAEGGTVASGKLTLEDFVCSTNISGGKALLLPNLTGDIALELFGTNSLTATAVSGKALNAPIYGSLSVSGTGSLTLNGGACGLSYNGVADGASLTIGGSASITANSIYSNSQINVDSGTLNCPNVYTETTFGKNGGTVNALVAEGKASYLANAVFSVYGDVTLAADTTILDKSAGDGLSVNPGATLTIPAGKTLTVQDDSSVDGVPQITNSGTIVNNGTIVLPSTYAENIPAAIKALGLTGSGKVTVGGTDYSNAGGKALGALAFTNETTSSATSLDNDGYTYVKGDGVGTLTLQNAAVIASAENGISFKKESTAPAMTFAIVLVGQNSVSVSSSNAYKCSGIYSNADLTVSGGGTLDVSALSTCNGGYCYGIRTTDEGNLTINSDVTASAASGTEVAGNSNYGIRAGGDLTVGASRTVTATAGNADWGSEGISVTGNLSLENGAVTTASSGDTTSGYSTGVYGYADLTLGEGAKLSATAGKALNSSEHAYYSTGLWFDGAVSLGTNATLEATGADANANTKDKGASSSYGLDIGGLIVGDGASVTAKSGSAETTYGISNYGANINVAGGTVTAAAGNATGADSYSFGINVANCNIIVTGAGTVDAAGGKATDSVGIELEQGYFYSSTSAKIIKYYDNGKLILSGSAKVTAKSGDPAGAYPGSVGLICPGLSLSDSAFLDAQGVNFGIRAAFKAIDGNGYETLIPAAISVSGSASLSAAAKSAALPSFGLQGYAAVDVSGGTAKFAGSTAAVYLYGEASNVTVGSGLTAATTPAGGTLKSALISGTVTYKSYTAGAELAINETTGVPTNACAAVTIAKPAPASSSSPGGSSAAQTTTNPGGSTTTVVTKPDGSTTTTVKQPDGVSTVTNADKSGKPTGVTVTVPDTVQGDVSVSIPAGLGKADGAVSAVVTYPDGTKKTVVGNYSDGKINLDVSGSAAIEILDDFVPLASLPLTDVPSDAYYYDAVIWAAMNGITGGKTASAFAPDETCTREQMVTFLWRAAGSPKNDGAMGLAGFDDVGDISSYAYDAMHWGVTNGIVTGTSGTTLSPKATVNRAQALTFLWRAAGKPVVNYAMNFGDVPANAYYTEAVRWAVSEKITEGTATKTFSPARSCTRAQIVTFLWRQLGK